MKFHNHIFINHAGTQNFFSLLNFLFLSNKERIIKNIFINNMGDMGAGRGIHFFLLEIFVRLSNSHINNTRIFFSLLENYNAFQKNSPSIMLTTRFLKLLPYFCHFLKKNKPGVKTLGLFCAYFLFN